MQIAARSGRGRPCRPATLLVMRLPSVTVGHQAAAGPDGCSRPRPARSAQAAAVGQPGPLPGARLPGARLRRRPWPSRPRTRLDPGRVAGVEIQCRFPSRGGGEPGPTTAAPVGRWWYSKDEAGHPGVTPCREIPRAPAPEGSSGDRGPGAAKPPARSEGSRSRRPLTPAATAPAPAAPAAKALTGRRDTHRPRRRAPAAPAAEARTVTEPATRTGRTGRDEAHRPRRRAPPAPAATTRTTRTGR